MFSSEGTEQNRDPVQEPAPTPWSAHPRKFSRKHQLKLSLCLQRMSSKWTQMGRDCDHLLPQTPTQLWNHQHLFPSVPPTGTQPLLSPFLLPHTFFLQQLFIGAYFCKQTRSVRLFCFFLQDWCLKTDTSGKKVQFFAPPSPPSHGTGAVMSHCSFIFPATLAETSFASAASAGREERYNMYRRNCSAKKFMFQFDLFFYSFLLTFIIFFPLILFFKTGLLGSHTLKPPSLIAVDIPEICMISYKVNLKSLTFNTSKFCASKAHEPFKITSL